MKQETRKRTDVQDVDIANIKVDRAAKLLYLEMHFTTVEFDYRTGLAFHEQFKRHLDLIQPALPMVTVPSPQPQ